jgi:hypothetical protein
MPTSAARHPYLDLFAACLVPLFKHGAEHTKDPPPIDALLPLAPATPEAQALLALLSGADHDLRTDHARAAALNLELAEARLNRAIRQDGASPGLEAALAGIVRAREELARGQVARSCAAVTDSVRAVIGPAARR